MIYNPNCPIDYETDTVIQKSLRTELNNDVTLITIAHRLQTIMDSDKIVSQTNLGLQSLKLISLSHRWSWTQGTLYVAVENSNVS